jgi:predicted alpha/beta-hydrolase family hydrolase
VSAANANKINIRIDDSHTVSGLLEQPRHARACYVLAHGAGAGMLQPFMAAIAAGLGKRGIATLRYQFPYMEQGSKRPDAPRLAHATVCAAVAEAARLVPQLPVVAGGKSFGGRMTSQTQAISPLADVRGLAFLGFPLHPARKPSDDRAQHLFDVRIPMLFLQGTRDALADLSLLAPIVQRLGTRATLGLFAGADHSFQVVGRAAQSDNEVRDELLDALTAWIDQLAAG